MNQDDDDEEEKSLVVLRHDREYSFKIIARNTDTDMDMDTDTDTDTDTRNTERLVIFMFLNSIRTIFSWSYDYSSHKTIPPGVNDDVVDDDDDDDGATEVQTTNFCFLTIFHHDHHKIKDNNSSSRLVVVVLEAGKRRILELYYTIIHEFQNILLCFRVVPTSWHNRVSFPSPSIHPVSFCYAFLIARNLFFVVSNISYILSYAVCARSNSVSWCSFSSSRNAVNRRKLSW